MFRQDNTQDFTDIELDVMNKELQNRLETNELLGLDEQEREKIISEDICSRF